MYLENRMGAVHGAWKTGVILSRDLRSSITVRFPPHSLIPMNRDGTDVSILRRPFQMSRRHNGLSQWSEESSDIFLIRVKKWSIGYHTQSPCNDATALKLCKRTTCIIGPLIRGKVSIETNGWEMSLSPHDSAVIKHFLQGSIQHRSQMELVYRQNWKDKCKQGACCSQYNRCTWV